jgi:hypothetical protein
VEVLATAGGTWNAVVCWFRLQLDDETTLVSYKEPGWTEGAEAEVRVRFL